MQMLQTINQFFTGSNTPTPVSAPASTNESVSQTTAKVQSELSKVIKIENHLPQLSWHERIIAQLNSWDKKLDEAMPNNKVQNKIDEIRVHLEQTFAPLNAFNKWLNDNGQGDWYLQLATFLAKLPIRAVRNVVQIIYSIINEIFYLATHPLKGVNHLAKLLVSLAKALTQPETWPKIGMGMIGTLSGQSFITGNPLSIIGIGIGAAMTVAGLSISVLKTTKEKIVAQVTKFPEYLLTGFLIGLLTGAIQRAMKSNKPEKLRQHQAQIQSSPINNYKEAQAYAERFIKENSLPEYSNMTFDASGKITIEWNNIDYFTQKYPELFKNQYSEIEFPMNLKMEIHCRSPQIEIEFHGWDGFEGYDYVNRMSLDAMIDTLGWSNHPGTIIQKVS